MRIDASLVGYRELMRWAKQFPERRWAVENARGLGRHLAQWLVARGEVVLDVPSTATARVRELSRGSRRKTDVIDAATAESVAALHGDATVVTAEDHTTVFALLEERRANVAAQRDCVANQLHAVLRDLTPGGAALAITAKSAATLLRSIRTRHRLSRAGGRRLNSAIHLIAVTQVRMRNSIGRAYFDKKIAEGKTRNEAMRCLKRRLANHIWRMMIADERRLTDEPTGPVLHVCHSGTTQLSHHVFAYRSRDLAVGHGDLVPD